MKTLLLFALQRMLPFTNVVNEQKVRLLSEVVKPSAAVYDTVVECDLSRQKSRT